LRTAVAVKDMRSTELENDKVILMERLNKEKGKISE
jgi:hypothetical protein